MTSGRPVLRLTASLLFLAVISASAAGQANPFLSSDNEQSLRVAPSPGVSEVSGANWYRRLIDLQRRIQNGLSDIIATQRDEPRFSGLLLLLAGAFAYGFLHALGPGHRKVVLSSYFLGEGGTVGAGVLTSFGIAFVHAGAAIALVFGLYALINGPVMTRFNAISIDIERTSYYLLIAIGVLLLIMDLVAHARPRNGGPESQKGRAAGVCRSFRSRSVPRRRCGAGLWHRKWRAGSGCAVGGGDVSRDGGVAFVAGGRHGAVSRGDPQIRNTVGECGASRRESGRYDPRADCRDARCVRDHRFRCVDAASIVARIGILSRSSHFAPLKSNVAAMER